MGDDTSPTEELRGVAAHYPSPASSHGAQETTSTRVTGAGRCPSRYDWSKHMSAIKRLYIDEDRPLKEVMEVMQKEHNFVATARMYKIRLKKWGYTKNVSVRSEEIEPLLRLLNDAGSQGNAEAPSSEVKLATGRVVGLDRLAAHLKRKTQRLSATDTRRPSQLSVAHYRHGGSPSPKSLAINSPDIFRISELVFADVHAYVCGRIMDPGEMSVSNTNTAVTTVSTAPVFSMVHSARQFLQEDRLDEALALLRLAPGRIRDVIRYEPPDALHCIFMVIVHLLTISGAERLVSSVRALISYASAMADERSAKWSPQYPLRRILRCLSTLSTSDDFALRDMAVHAWKCLLRSQDLALGAPACAETFPKWLDLGESGGFDVLPSDLLEKMHWEVYRRSVEEFGEKSRAAWTELYWLSELERQKVNARKLPTDKLQRLLEETLNILERLPPPQGLAARYNCQAGLARIYKQEGQLALAESRLRAAIDTSILRNGQDYPITLSYILELETWLIEWGDDVKVEELKQWQAAILVNIEKESIEQIS
ncbi:hypothetical protein VP1G_03775 [Cytospora mali]|uniref:Clr5 domain-containing protein n=1 Tax=Cytospora mali TaxID=578113 RepID=A0A194UXK5_CYTMA|nr:hypothetical protein VP1G_03775 [Valsa mali var. pyri (nom. inval.)]